MLGKYGLFDQQSYRIRDDSTICIADDAPILESIILGGCDETETARIVPCGLAVRPSLSVIFADLPLIS